MKIIKQILDDDYGCEEKDENAPIKVILLLEDELNNKSYHRIDEKILFEQNLKVGDIFEI